MAGKSISASVGQGGVNLPKDVVTVQFLLNCVPVSDGGPNPELVIDGLVGPKTNGAILRFQRAHFDFADGRVDAENRGGVTIVELKKFDPTPDVPLNPNLPPFKFPGAPPGRQSKRPGKKIGGVFTPFLTGPAIPVPGTPFGKKIGGKGRGKKTSG